jgi:hypothetical protein
MGKNSPAAAHGSLIARAMREMRDEQRPRAHRQHAAAEAFGRFVTRGLR